MLGEHDSEQQRRKTLLITHALLPHAEPAELRVRVYACFGLINSTPHSVRGVRWSVPDGPAAPVLEAMALAALTADADA